MNKTTIFGVAVTSLAAAAAVWLAVEVNGTDKTYSSSGLPKCESTMAEDALKESIKEGIYGKLGTKLLLVEDKKTISSSEKENKCEAKIFLSQGGNYRVSYTFTHHGSQWLMQMASISD